MKLTQKNVFTKPAPAQGQRIYLHKGGEGFGLRVTKNNARSYIFQFRDPTTKKQKRQTLGSVDTLTFDEAIEQARELRKAIRDGKAEEMQRNTKYTLRRLREDYERIHLHTLRPNTRRDDENAWLKYVVQEKKPRKNEEPFTGPKLADKLVKDITNIDIRDLHIAITDHGNPFSANRVRMMLSSMFGIAIDKRIISHNPCRDRRWKKWRNDDIQRERFLDKEELARLYDYLGKHEDRQFAAFVELLLLTGCRRGELEAATWDQFDLDARRWVKPETKTGIHKVRIFPEAVAVLRRLKAGQTIVSMKGDDWLFPAPTRSGHYENPKGLWRRLCIDCGFVDIDENGNATPNFTPHDCRHTFATWAVKRGVRVTSLKQLLNHASVEMTQRYYHIDEDDEDEALELMRGSPLTGAAQ